MLRAGKHTIGNDEFYLATLVRWYKPDVVVELGTGNGAMAARVMHVLPQHGVLFCVNWPNPPSGDNPARYLEPWFGDPRLTIIYGDTRDSKVVDYIPYGIDILHIDSTHEAKCIAKEWELYIPKLADNAIIVVDDLNHNDMMIFWDTIYGDKEVVYNGRVGILRYKR